MNNPFKDGVFTVIFRPPNFGESIAVEMRVDPDLCDGAIDRLPVDREIPWEFDAHLRTMKQKEARRRMMDWLSENLAEHLMKAIEERDTVNGYPKTKKAL